MRYLFKSAIKYVNLNSKTCIRSQSNFIIFHLRLIVFALHYVIIQGCTVERREGVHHSSQLGMSLWIFGERYFPFELCEIMSVVFSNDYLIRIKRKTVADVDNIV